MSSFDGRPMSWKNRDWNFNYQSVSFRKKGKFGFIGIGDAGGTIMMGLNEQGLALGNTLIFNLNSSYGSNKKVMYWLLYNLSSIDSCKKVFDGATKGVANYYNTDSTGHPSFSLPIIDMSGNSIYVEVGGQTPVLNENGSLVPAYFEYDPLNFSPDKVRKQGVVVRANTSHNNSSGDDDSLSGGDRYVLARDCLHNAAIRDGICSTSTIDNNGITLQEMFAVSRLGEPGVGGGICSDMTISTMIAHGVRKNGAVQEDPKIAVMWSALYKPDYIPYIPVWAELGRMDEIPERLNSENEESTLSFQANRIYQKKNSSNYDLYINKRLEPLEDNFIEVVTDARSNWFKKGFSYSDARRICAEASESSFWTLKTMADDAQIDSSSVNMTPYLSEIKTSCLNEGLQFSCATHDLDGTIASYFWEFGDNTTSYSKTPVHHYPLDKEYLVMCRITDNSGARNSRWKYVIYNGKNTITNYKITPKFMAVVLENNNVMFTVDLDIKAKCLILVYNIKGQKVWGYDFQNQNKGTQKIFWRRSAVEIGNAIYMAKLVFDNTQLNKKIVICK